MSEYYLAARTAQKNPEINGRRLYFTSLGFWTLDVNNAKRFATKGDAEAVLNSGDLEPCAIPVTP